MYPSYDRLSRDMIIYFLNKHFPDHDSLIRAINPMHYEHDVKQFEHLFVEEDFKKDYRILNKAVRDRGQNIPYAYALYREALSLGSREGADKARAIEERREELFARGKKQYLWLK